MFLNAEGRGELRPCMAVCSVVNYRARMFNRAAMVSVLFRVNKVTTCLENLEMSGNLTAVREMSWILLKIRELSGKKSCQGKVA